LCLLEWGDGEPFAYTEGYPEEATGDTDRDIVAIDELLTVDTGDG
jgi:hypothetical protein